MGLRGAISKGTFVVVKLWNSYNDDFYTGWAMGPGLKSYINIPKYVANDYGRTIRRQDGKEMLVLKCQALWLLDYLDLDHNKYCEFDKALFKYAATSKTLADWLANKGDYNNFMYTGKERKMTNSNNIDNMDTVTLLQMSDETPPKFYDCQYNDSKKRYTFKSMETLSPGELVVVSRKDVAKYDIVEVVEEVLDFWPLENVKYQWVVQVLKEEELRKLPNRDIEAFRALTRAQVRKRALEYRKMVEDEMGVSRLTCDPMFNDGITTKESDE